MAIHRAPGPLSRQRESAFVAYLWPARWRHPIRFANPPSGFEFCLSGLKHFPNVIAHLELRASDLLRHHLSNLCLSLSFVRWVINIVHGCSHAGTILTAREADRAIEKQPHDERNTLVDPQQEV